LSYPATNHPLKPELPIGHTFIELQSVDSTNNYAMAKVHAGLALHGTIFFAHEQFAGKGQRGKNWSAKPGENITMSIVLQPAFLSINQQFLLGACIAVACYDFLHEYLTDNIFIKWPNDLYLRDRKAGGILIENILHGNNWQYAIAGIGININQEMFDKHLPNPVSLKQVTGKTYDIINMAKALCNCIEKRYCELLPGKNNDIITCYNQYLYKRNERVKLKRGDTVFETTIKEVSPQGKLIAVDEEERSFDFGEVQWETTDLI
jgi:BirA family transcriptional regulator, biotin operon repressor / biotin---[acetyl-CoA-carboxylase] ligase